MEDKLDKAKQIAKDTMSDIKAVEAKKQAEAKVAVETQKKDEGLSIVAEVEKKAEYDARVLSTEDEKLSDEDKKLKAELTKAKDLKEEKVKPPVEDKEAKIKSETQKRIDEVIGELKAEKAERLKLEAKLSELTKPKTEEDKATKIKRFQEQQIAKYLEEDKDTARESKREMPKEELEEWLLEDYVAATEWLTDRNIRRNDEKKQIEHYVSNVKPASEEFIAKQQESLQRLQARYPKVSDKDSAELRLLNEIIKEDPKKYAEAINGPELAADEMDKRRTKPSKKTITLTEEELAERIKEGSLVEAQRLAGLDEGISSGGNGKRMQREEKKSEFRLKQEAIARKAGIPMEKLDAAIKRREEIGASSYNDGDE